MARIQRYLWEEVDPASLVVFRVVYGVMAAISAARFLWYGWVDRFFYQPEVFFHFPGFQWVAPLPEPGMEVLFGLLVACGLAVASGWFWRVALGVFVVGFTYVGLIDTTTYLNHYWQFRFIGFLMLFMPLSGAGEGDRVPAWPVWTLRLQLGLVYFWAGVAKLNGDWLLRGQPMEIWLTARTHLPVVGPLLAYDFLPHAMSIAGAVFDLTILGWLLWPKSRPYAYAAVVFFHAATGFLFNIGMFPVIMIGATTIFFAPDWPRRFIRSRGIPALARLRGLPTLPKRAVLVLLSVWFALQFTLPLRHLAYPGDVLWTQEGYRFSWRVKLAERSGSLTYTVRDPSTDKTWRVHPTRYLSRRQNELASAEPAKILQLAHHIAGDFARRGHPNVAVYADCRVALNGHPSRRLIDPDVDLASQPYTIWHRDWIVHD